MLLGDLLVPNQFGNTPILHLPGNGILTVFQEKYAKFINSGVLVDLNNRVRVISKPDDLDLWISIQMEDYTPEVFKNRYVRVMQYVLLTPEQYVINTTLNSNGPVLVSNKVTGTDSGMVSMSQIMTESISSDGSCLVAFGDDSHPMLATAFVEDILYRLDLQNKVT